MKNTKNVLADRVAELVAIARDYHRRHDVVSRAQTEETIRQIAPRAMAARAIKQVTR